MTSTERVLARVVCDVASRCWVSDHRADSHGYTQIAVAGRRWLTHRLAYELFIGPIPGGMTLDHLCRNPPCCNPDHLESVPHRTNVLRGESFSPINAAKTHCANGHPFDAENTKSRTGGGRRCRACHNADARRRSRAGG